MIKLASLARTFNETGALNANVPIFGFIDDHAFITKAGDLGIVLKVEGVDYECLDPAQMDYYAKRLQSALKLFDGKFRIYQYLFKHNNPSIPHQASANPVVDAAIRDRMAYFQQRADRLYTVDIYYVILYEAFRHKADFFSALAKLPNNPKEAFRDLRGLFSTKTQIRIVRGAIDRARVPLARAVDNFVLQVQDLVRVQKLGKQEAFLVFRQLLNFNPAKVGARLKYDTNADFFLSDSQLDCHPTHLLVDNRYYTRVLTLKEPTAQSWPLVLRHLYEISGNYHVVTEWKPIENDKAKRKIQAHRRHFHNTKTSLMSQMTAGDNAQADVLVDDSKAAIVQNLAELKKEIELKGNYLGNFSLTAVLYDKDKAALEKACGEFYKVFSMNDGAIYDESYNLLNAFFATLPGNYFYNVRQVDLLNTNYADYSFFFTLHTGDRKNRHLDREYLGVFETQHGTPYYFNLHHNDIAHTLILGMTGAGKSFLLNFLITNAQKYEPFTFIFDLGGSYQGITRLLEGSYLRIGVESREFSINPFTLEPTKDNLNFLFSFVKVLLEGNAAEAPLAVTDDKELYAGIENLYQVDPSIRRLSTLSSLLPKHLSERLGKWTEGGQYDFVFDNAADTLTFGRFQCLDFEGMNQHPDVIQPLLFYVLHRANNVIYDPAISTTFKMFVMDEAWRFFQHPTIRAYIVEALKTWRKKNAAMILATQSIDELRKSEILHVVNESCPTKIFLANPEMDAALYRETFHLNETELDLIHGLIPKRQFLLKRPDYAKVLTLQVDRKSYFLYTNDPNDNHKRDLAIQQYGFERALEVLAGKGSAPV